MPELPERQRATELIAQALFLNSPHRRNVPPGHLPRDWWEQVPPLTKREYLSDAEAVLRDALPTIEAAAIAKERERWEAQFREKAAEELAIADRCPLGSMGALAERARGRAYEEAAEALNAMKGEDDDRKT